MADEPDDDDILAVLNRVGPKWTTLSDLIKKEVAEALKNPATPEEQPGSYLEKQNAMLLSELLQLKKGDQSIPEPSGPQSNEPSNPPASKPSGPKSKDAPKPPTVEPKKAFWR